MKVVGVICEYNPFHNGHAYQLKQAKTLSHADFTVCVMSGAFVQRGEPAVLDKWTRAEMALRNGADVVLELPALFAVRSAQDFAFGGVSLLDSLNVVTHLSFGAETDDLQALLSLTEPESPEISAKIKEGLSHGLSYPAVLQSALGRELLPNDILAVEYLRSLKKLNSPMEPIPVHRVDPHNGAASSTAIRKAILSGADFAENVPENTLSLLKDNLPTKIPTLDGFSQAILYLLRTTPPEALAARFAIPEGLENRLCREAFSVSTVSALVEAVKSRRYSEARIRRLLVQILLGFDKRLIFAHPAPEYARVLGFKTSAAPLLKEMQEKSSVPILLKTADAPKTTLLQCDFTAQNVWDLLSGLPAHRDFTEKIRVIKDI